MADAQPLDGVSDETRDEQRELMRIGAATTLVAWSRSAVQEQTHEHADRESIENIDRIVAEVAYSTKEQAKGGVRSGSPSRT